MNINGISRLIPDIVYFNETTALVKTFVNFNDTSTMDEDPVNFNETSWLDGDPVHFSETSTLWEDIVAFNETSSLDEGPVNFNETSPASNDSDNLIGLWDGVRWEQIGNYFKHGEILAVCGEFLLQSHALLFILSAILIIACLVLCIWIYYRSSDLQIFLFRILIEIIEQISMIYHLKTRGVQNNPHARGNEKNEEDIEMKDLNRHHVIDIYNFRRLEEAPFQWNYRRRILGRDSTKGPWKEVREQKNERSEERQQTTAERERSRLSNDCRNEEDITLTHKVTENAQAPSWAQKTKCSVVDDEIKEQTHKDPLKNGQNEVEITLTHVAARKPKPRPGPEPNPQKNKCRVLDDKFKEEKHKQPINNGQNEEETTLTHRVGKTPDPRPELGPKPQKNKCTVVEEQTYEQPSSLQRRVSFLLENETNDKTSATDYQRNLKLADRATSLLSEERDVQLKFQTSEEDKIRKIVEFQRFLGRYRKIPRTKQNNGLELEPSPISSVPSSSRGIVFEDLEEIFV